MATKGKRSVGHLSSMISVDKVLLALLVMISNGFPVGNERWTNPCGSAMSHDQPPLPSQQEVLTGLIIRLNEGIQIASQLQNKYANERVRNPSYTALLNEMHLEGFEIEVITEDAISSAIQNISRSLLNSFKHISIAAIFIEQVKFDENNFEHGAFISDITVMETKLYTVLCHVQMAINQLEIDIENYQSRDVMSTELRTIQNKADRTDRDYIIVKDTRLTFQSALVKYEAVKDSLNS